MIRIDRNEIEVWGRLFDAKGNFPKLIAKLIRETTPKSTSLQIPSGSAVYIGGWDGIVVCKEDVGYVPEGISLWEIGTNGDPAKANRDYNKRTRDSLGFDKKEACYIAVTTRLWEDKQDWIKEKMDEGVWKSVKAYDSTDIAEWLENAQISCRWFSVLTQNHPYDGIYNAEEYWKMLSSGPKGYLPPKIVTAGRERESEKLLQFLKGEPALKAVKGATKEEAIAFIIASVMAFDQHTKDSFFARSVVVDNERHFHGLRINKNSINLIAKLEVTGKLYTAVLDNGHHVLVPLGPDDSFGSQDFIDLPRIEKEGQVEALQEMGLSSEEAQIYSKEAGRDYTILKNLLGFPPEGMKWKDSNNITELVPLLLIGRWDETKEGDRKIIERLSGTDYETYSQKLSKWLEVESPPILKIGELWRLTSPLDAWTNLSHLLSARDFENLKVSFLEVMKEKNPVFDLEPKQRSMAPFLGKESLYSSWCREGITQTLILVGLHGNKFVFHHRLKSQDWVDGIIKELLFKAPGVLWISRNKEMPLLAEASPTSFFESAYHSLSLDDKPIMDMFIEEDSPLFPTSHHSGLLWALEGLAWTEENLYNASLLLAKLASLDPGGKLANRPFDSLQEIFKPWHYQTLAPFEDRMKIIQQIVKREPEVGWNLLNGMISDGFGTAIPTHKLRWRIFERSFEGEYQWNEVLKTHSHVLEMLIENFDFSERRLVDLLKKSESKLIRLEDRERVLSFIELNLEKVKITDNSAWNHLRSSLSNHRTHPHAKWALPEQSLKIYEDLYKKLKPTDPVESVRWMFEKQWPNFPDGIVWEKGKSIEEREKIVRERRIEGLKMIYEENGLEKIEELAIAGKEPWIYGLTLANFLESEDEILSLCKYLKEEDRRILFFIQRFISSKSIFHGVDWVFNLFSLLKRKGYSNKHLARVFYQVEQSKKVWDFLETESLEIQNHYWKDIYPRFSWLEGEAFVYGINKLLDARRYVSALDVVGLEPSKVSSQKLVDVLEKTATHSSDEEKGIDGYMVGRILEELYERKDIQKNDLIRIEWLFLEFLASYESSRKPILLYEELANNPRFFIEVLTLLYKSEKEDEQEEDTPDELKVYRVRNAYKLLRYWEKVPGVDNEYNIDEKFLKGWIEEARGLADKSGRLKVADIHIGKILAQYPESEEPWPPKEISYIIETINTKNLKSGFSTAAFNKRGSSSRGVFDGGDIERGHAEFFHTQAKSIEFEFPETAKILTNLALGYEEDAKRRDEEAERDKLDS